MGLAIVIHTGFYFRPHLPLLSVVALEVAKSKPEIHLFESPCQRFI